MENTILKQRIDEVNYKKLEAVASPALYEFIQTYIEHCNPESVFVCDGSADDLQYIRDLAIKNCEERDLALDGHTVHYDGYYDQARDKENTKLLMDEMPFLNTRNRDEGLAEVKAIMKDIMKGKQMLLLFFCLGPTGSEFSQPCVQITDSAYVAHSESLLYRQGYGEFKNLDGKEFFKFVHSAGELENNVCKNLDKRRIYIDIEGKIVYSANAQYGGNVLGLKKLAMRLAIKKSSQEGWLTEHMFIMGVRNAKDKSRTTYFTGAYPSLCGKTSTAMLPSEKIVGDDIAYIRERDGKVYAANVEKGVFGIIEGVNSKDDPILWKALHNKGEIIFSNILTNNDKPYWKGMDSEMPSEGINHSGDWQEGKKDAKDAQIPCSHPNARFTLDMTILGNLDSELDNPEGVLVGGVIYGGRDSDTWVPVEETFDWVHGVITKGLSLESETTAATLGQAGVRKFNPASNLDFLCISLGEYAKNYLDFGKKLTNAPKVFSANYFICNKEGNFLNEKTDKAVWLKWMEMRVHGDAEAIKTPTGFIPEYKDLKELFKLVLDKEYSEEDYVAQFMLRVPEHLAKIERITKVYKQIPDAPQIVFDVFKEQTERLKAAQKEHGDYIVPEKFL